MQNILIVFQLLPALIAALKAVEDAIPGSGQGEAKLAAVLGMLQAVDEAYVKLWPQICGVVSALVTLFNTTGVFGTKK